MTANSELPLAPSEAEIPAEALAPAPILPAPLTPPPGSQEDEVFAARAAEARELAWDLAAEPFFGEDMPLKPWSRERHLLAMRLIAMDVPGPPLEELGRLQLRGAEWAKARGIDTPPLTDFVDILPYVPAAEKILFIAAHDPQELAHLRGPRVERFFSAIAKWSEANIRPDQFELACLTALQLTTQHEQMMAMPQPGKKGRADSGN